MIENDVILDDERIKVEKQGDYLAIKYKTSYTIKIDSTNRQEIDNEVIRMLRIETQPNKKLFLQKEVGRIIGVSRQMINRRWRVYIEEGLMALLSEEYHKSKLTPNLLSRLEELYIENPFLKKSEIRNILINEKLCKNITDSTIGYARKKLDSNRMIWLLRKKSDRSVPNEYMSSGYLIDKLFIIIENLLSRIPGKISSFLLKNIYIYKSYFTRAAKKGIGPTAKDKYKKRIKLERDKRRNKSIIRRLLMSLSCTNRCPDCKSNNVKQHSKRDRYYKNEDGERIMSYSIVYKCQNESCATKYYTIPPRGVELYARVHKKIKKMIFRWIFHLRASMSRVADELLENGIKVSKTTIVRWVKKAGEECVDVFDLKQEEDWEQPICIDEKWIKVRNEWCYVFTAVGSRVQDLLLFDLYWNKDKEAMKSFLLKLKSLGYNPKSITTDLLMGYEVVVKEVFPEAYYHQCVLHAERDAKRLVRNHLTGEENEEWRKKLTKAIRKLFGSKNPKQVKKRMGKLMCLQQNAPEEANSTFKMLEKYYPKLYNSFIVDDLQKTTNAVERAIGEFEEKYHTTKGFSSFHYANFFLKVFQVYYRFRKISFGPLRGFSRLQIKDSKIGKFHFTDYLTPTYSY